MPSSEPLLHSKPNELTDLSAGQPSLLLSSQESLGAPASEQVQEWLVLMIPAFALSFGLTCYVHLPEMCTVCMHIRHSQTANKMQNGHTQ